MRIQLNALGLGLLLLLQPACGLLDTNRPDTIDPNDLDNADGATALYIGGLANFNIAKDGDGDVDVGAGTDGQVIDAGLYSDEFALSTTPPTQQEIDQRQIDYQTNGTIFSLYLALHKARAGTELAALKLAQFSPDTTSDPRIPEMLALAGFTYVYFGEDFCSGVPYSSINGSTVVYDSSKTTLQTLQRAIARFDSALASPALPIEVEYLARIGKARALLSISADSSGIAAALVSVIPTTFHYDTEHAAVPATLQNAVNTFSQGSLISVLDSEGGNGLPYHSDPRTMVDSVPDGAGGALPGLDLSTPQYFQRKYPDPAASIPVADGIEARLIEAENELQLGAYGTMTGILNTLRTTAINPALPALAIPGSQAAAEDQLFSERAYWLFATGHRLGDMRRLVRQYGRLADNVFPVGPYLKGGNYGTNVSLTIPFEVEINPLFDRAQCDADVP